MNSGVIFFGTTNNSHLDIHPTGDEEVRPKPFLNQVNGESNSSSQRAKENMAKFNVVVDHETKREHAVSRLRTFSDRIREDVPVEVTEVDEVWDEAGNLDFSFKAMGFKVSGKMVTCEYKVTIAGHIPFAALPFRGAIESQIADKVKEAVNGDEENGDSEKGDEISEGGENGNSIG